MLCTVLDLGPVPSLKRPISIDRVFEIEKTTKHDVKAVELAIAEQLDNEKLQALIHACLTSQDVNSLALTLQVKTCIAAVVIPHIQQTVDTLRDQFFER